MNAIIGSTTALKIILCKMNRVPFEHSKGILQDPIRFSSVGHAIEAGYYSGRVLHGHESLSRIPRGAPGCFCQMTWRWIIHPAHAARWRSPRNRDIAIRADAGIHRRPCSVSREGPFILSILSIAECRDSKNAFQCSSSRPCIKRVSSFFSSSNSGSYGVSSRGLSRRVDCFSAEWYAGVLEIAAILLVYIANIMEYTISCKGTLIYKIINFGSFPVPLILI